MPSSKVFESKQAVVNKLKDLFQGAETIVLADYRGLTVEQDTELRKALRENGVSYHVFKNRLAKIAAKEAGLEGLAEYLQGPTAFAVSKTDAVLLRHVYSNNLMRNLSYLYSKAVPMPVWFWTATVLRLWLISRI